MRPRWLAVKPSIPDQDVETYFVWAAVLLHLLMFAGPSNKSEQLQSVKCVKYAVIQAHLNEVETMITLV